MQSWRIAAEHTYHVMVHSIKEYESEKRNEHHSISLNAVIINKIVKYFSNFGKNI